MNEWVVYTLIYYRKDFVFPLWKTVFATADKNKMQQLKKTLVNILASTAKIIWKSHIVREFLLPPLRDIKKHVLYLNIESCNEQCIGQSLTAASHSARSLQRYISSNSLHLFAPAPVLWASAWNTIAWPWLHVLTPSALEHSYFTVATKQICGCFLYHCERKLHSLTRSPSVPGFPNSSQFHPFCSQVFLPSIPHHSSVTHYHCWAVKIWICLSVSS